VEDGEDITTGKVWSVARGADLRNWENPRRRGSEMYVIVEVIDALWPSYTSLYVLQETRPIMRAFIWLC